MNNLYLGQNNQYLSIDLAQHWDIQSLQKTLNQCRSLAKVHNITRLLISGNEWVAKTSDIDAILSIGETMSQSFETNSKIAVVSNDSNSQNEILENALSLKGIKLLHFKTVDHAKHWLTS